MGLLRRGLTCFVGAVLPLLLEASLMLRWPGDAVSGLRHQLSTIVYNPMTLCETGRLEDISTAVQHTDIVILAGTRVPARDRPVFEQSTHYHHCYHFG